METHPDTHQRKHHTRSPVCPSDRAVRTLGVGPVLVGLVLVGLMVSGCGLPTIPFLAPPQNPGSDGLNEENLILTFEHNPDNIGDDFRGYELYYKLYADDQTQRIRADENAIASTPVQPGTTRLQQRGFVRAVVVSERDSEDPNRIVGVLPSDALPHFPTTAGGSALEFRIDVANPLGDDPDADVLVRWEEGSGRVRGIRRRNVQRDFAADPADTLDSFWDRAAYDKDDWDVERMGLDDDLPDDGPQRLIVIFYVLSYGIDPSTFSGYYSEPLRLNRALIITRQ